MNSVSARMQSEREMLHFKHSLALEIQGGKRTTRTTWTSGVLQPADFIKYYLFLILYYAIVHNRANTHILAHTCRPWSGPTRTAGPGTSSPSRASPGRRRCGPQPLSSFARRLARRDNKSTRNKALHIRTAALAKPAPGRAAEPGTAARPGPARPGILAAADARAAAWAAGKCAGGCAGRCVRRGGAG